MTENASGASTGSTVRFLHTSDWQLGMTRWFLKHDDGEAQARFSSDRLEAVRRIGRLAQERGAEFIVVAGDVFESNTLPERDVLRAMDVIRELPVPVYLLPGNHDALDATSIYHRDMFTEAEERGVHVLRDSVPVQVRPGVEIVGAPLTSRVMSEDALAAALDDLEPTAGVRVAVAHGQVVGFGDEVGATLSVDAVGRAVGKRLVHYVAVGDSHSTARLDDDGRMWFSGSPETTDYDDKERDSGNVLLVEVGPDTAPTVEDIAVGAWRFRAMRREFAGAEDAERWIEELRLLTDKSRTCVKYSLSGTLNLSEKGELDRALAELAPSFAALYQRGSGTDVTVLPEDGDITALGLNGFPLDAAETLRDMANDEAVDAEQRRAATDALGLLARLVGQGK
ncbi:metallophosphoesterase [uncultured Corynebacterium sp.]|uniref:metallophosphoesterase family protein n=1 Tax=uncultured Corynebacterium sp. TaxID=159447 RepID=UPI002606AF9B|nr:metallophosphoesterase [uncultured Corynebacterium sp.]